MLRHHHLLLRLRFQKISTPAVKSRPWMIFRYKSNKRKHVWKKAMQKHRSLRVSHFLRHSRKKEKFSLLANPNKYRPLELKNIIIEDLTPPNGFPPPPSPTTLRRSAAPSTTDPRLDSNFSSVIAQRAAAAKARRHENPIGFEYNFNKLPASTTFFNNCITTSGLQSNGKWFSFDLQEWIDWLFAAICHHHYWTSFEDLLCKRFVCISWGSLPSCRVHDLIAVGRCPVGFWCAWDICVLVLVVVLSDFVVLNHSMERDERIEEKSLCISANNFDPGHVCRGNFYSLTSIDNMLLLFVLLRIVDHSFRSF